MLKPVHLRLFEKDVVKIKKQGKDIEKLKTVLNLLIQEKPLPQNNRNHKLKGEYRGYWECHIEPDWLLVYKKTKTYITFARADSHSALF